MCLDFVRTIFSIWLLRRRSQQSKKRAVRAYFPCFSLLASRFSLGPWSLVLGASCFLFLLLLLVLVLVLVLGAWQNFLVSWLVGLAAGAQAQASRCTSSRWQVAGGWWLQLQRRCECELLRCISFGFCAARHLALAPLVRR
jgi:hypothetical protein